MDQALFDERPTPRPWVPSVPGPVDRVSFFEEQARHRRATWRLTALCALTVAIMGLTLSMVLTPALYAVALVLSAFASLIVPTPDELWRGFQVMGTLTMLILGTLAGDEEVRRQVAAALPYHPVIQASLLTLGGLFLLVPGVVAMIVTWLFVRRLLFHAGVGGVLLALGAREPRSRDREEQQLVNVAAEMAIAAGLPPPRVMLLDGDGVNAAAIGSSPDDATIVVSRRMLDVLDRDETQGVIGHLIGSIGNGDLGIAFTIMSAFQAFGLQIALMNAPFGPKSRALLKRVGRLAIAAQRGDAHREADLLGAMLSEGLRIEEDSDLDTFADKMPAKPGFFDILRILPLIPWMLANLAIRFTLWVFISMIAGPAIALVWRTRRYLADATAVQLTRNPDGLAQALDVIVRLNTAVPGGERAGLLFILDPVLQGGTWMPAPEQLQRKSFAERVQVIRAAAVAAKGHRASARSFADEYGIMLGFHPPLGKRFDRLRAAGSRLGANVARPALDPKAALGHVLGIVIVGPLMAIGAACLLAAMMLFIGISLFFMGMFMVIVYGIAGAFGAFEW